MLQSVVNAASKQASLYNIPLENVAAVIEVESNGIVSAKVDGTDEPIVRWEGHYFDKRVKPELQKQARARGLASPKVGGVKNPAKQEDRWHKLIDPAQAMDKKAAIESVSYGVGQVMGAHWEALGYPDPSALESAARSGVDGQVDLMFRYIKTNNLVDELQRGDFAGFARGYNGPAYKTNKYDTKMQDEAKAFRASRGGGSAIVNGAATTRPSAAAKASTMLRMGVTGAKVRDLQTLLVRAGYAVKVDGDFGPSTKEAVIEFQKSTGLEQDGKVGPATWAKLDAYRVDPQEVAGQLTPVTAATATPEGRQGVATSVIGGAIIAAKAAVQQGIDAVSPSVGHGVVFDYTFAGLTAAGTALALAGVVWAVVGFYRSKKTHGVEAT